MKTLGDILKRDVRPARVATAAAMLAGWLGAPGRALAEAQLGPLLGPPLLAQRSYVFPTLGTVVLFSVALFVVCKSARRAQ